jgi:hypothetical protein
LEKLAEHEKKTGTRVLDVLDVHFYPQGANIYSSAADRPTSELRVRQTRGLWDPTYVDESWIKDAINLIPRLKKWIDESYPGRTISIGEWSFGGEDHWSGALTVAEALGRFGAYGVGSAFYWTLPPENSPAYWAFRAFRNFDEKGGHFEAISIPATAGEGASLFASRDASKKHIVLVALNLSADTALHADIDVTSCGGEISRKAYVYPGSGAGLKAGTLETSGDILSDLPPHSITVIEIATAP